MEALGQDSMEMGGMPKDGAQRNPEGAGRGRGVGAGATEPPAPPSARGLLSLKGRINECPERTSAVGLLLQACVPAAARHEGGVQGAPSALGEIELSPVESQHWPKRQS